MAAQAPVLISAIPPFPALSDRALGTYNSKAYAFGTHMGTTFDTEFNASVTNVAFNADVAFDSAETAVIAASEALDAQAAAEAAAAQAAASPGTNGTSTSSLNVALTTQNLVTQAGKIFPVGANITIARTSAPTTQMGAIVNTYDDTTGAMNFTVKTTVGTGTYSDWTVSIGVSSPANLPPLLVGDVGKLVGVVAGPMYGLVDGRGANGAIAAAGNVTLTAASAGAQKITPASPLKAMQFVQLPDATTMPVGLGVFSLENATGVDVEIRDNTTAAIGYIHPGHTALANLLDKSTAAGTWSFVGAEIWGTLQTQLTITNSGRMQSMCPIDTTRDLVVYSSAAGTFGIVWDNAACAFGTAVLLTTHVPGATTGYAQARAVKLDTNKMFVGIQSAASASVGVVLTISGTTITPGTATTATGGDRLMDVVVLDNSTVAISYGTATPDLRVIAAVVTGTAVTWGASVTLFAGASFPAGNPSCLFDLSGGRFLVIVYGSFMNAAVGTVSGAGVITMGTSMGAITAGLNYWAARKLTSGRFALITGESSNTRGHILAVTGTTIAVTSALLVNGGGDRIGAAVAIGNQVLVSTSVSGSTSGFWTNVLTDNAGTAVAGTMLASYNPNGGNSTSGVSLLGYDSTSITVVKSLSTSSVGTVAVSRYGISGNNPILMSSQVLTSAAANAGGLPLPSDIFSGQVAAVGIYGRDTLVQGVVTGSRGSLDFTGGQGALGWKMHQGLASVIPRALMPTLTGTNAHAAARGGFDYQIWAAEYGGAAAASINLARLKVVP